MSSLLEGRIDLWTRSISLNRLCENWQWRKWNQLATGRHVHVIIYNIMSPVVWTYSVSYTVTYRILLWLFLFIVFSTNVLVSTLESVVLVPRSDRKVVHPLCLQATEKLSKDKLVQRTTWSKQDHQNTQILDSHTVSSYQELILSIYQSLGLAGII